MTDIPLHRRTALGLLIGVSLLAAVGALAARPDDPDLSGTWTWEWKDAQGVAHKHVLEVEGAGPKPSARERFDDEEPIKVKDLAIVGKKVTFSVLRGKRHAVYSGMIAEADTINGQVKIDTGGDQVQEFAWTARRKAAPRDEAPKGVD